MGRRRSRRIERCQAHLALTYEKSLDLDVRAKQAGVLQGMIGDFVAGLLVNGEPLAISVSAQRKFDPDPDHERVLISIYWCKTKIMNDLDVRTDIAFVCRCLKCGHYLLEEEHICPELPPYPSRENGPGDDQLNEIKD